MTTTTTTTPAKASSESVASSTRFRTFAVMFSITGPLIYLTCLAMGWPLFTFHPATNRLAWGYEAARSGEGPNMHWYGWTANALIFACLLGIVATMLPEKVTRKIPLILVWLIPILAVPYVIYDLRQWWLHP
jgi:hypothetical protein